MKHEYGGSSLLAVLALASVGCASSPAAPFNQMETSNVTAYRLQNYEPPSVLSTPSTTAATGAIPAPIQQWLQQGAQGLQQLIPPGLLPPGLLGQQGTGQPGQTQQSPLPLADNSPRFHGFRILGQTQVIDPELKAELADVLGDSDNFTPEHASCLYAEMGLSFSAQPGAAASNDVLISFSCNQVSSPTFAWPHPSSGLTADAVKSLSQAVQKLWPPGT